MSDADEGQPLASSAMDEALSEPDVTSNGSDPAARHSPESSNKSSHHEEDVAQQLAELKALNEKHSQIISLLQTRFDIPVDTSESASRLLNDVRDGWKRLSTSRKSAGVAYKVDYEDVHKTFLLQILPCGPQFMGLDVKETSCYGEDPGQNQTSTHESEKLIKEAEWRFGDGMRRGFMIEHSFPGLLSNQSTWRPEILLKGKHSSNEEELTWPSNWDFLFKESFRRQREHCWSFFVASSLEDWGLYHRHGFNRYGELDNPGAAFDMHRILMPFYELCMEHDTSPIEWLNLLPLLYGTICTFHVGLSQKLLSFEDIATVISMSSEPHRAGSLSLFTCHFGPWMGHGGSAGSSVFPCRAVRAISRGMLDAVDLREFTYCMKSFKFTGENETGNANKMEARKTSSSSDRETPPSGLRFERDALSVEKAPGRRITFLEHRYSTHLTMTPLRAPIGNFRLFTITDYVEGHPYYIDPAISMFNWKEKDIHPAGLLTGVAAFQAQMHCVISDWADDWGETLSQLSAVFSVTPITIGNEKELEELMYDPELKRTRTYFKVLQTLRIFTDAIEDAEVAFESFIDESSGWEYYGFEFQSLQEEGSVIDHNWATLKALHQQKTKKLLLKISAMKKEIESLRDGLFNAQSVREAQKSRELNKIMMVFTIVTILFLPPTFVATFFGVEIFHAASEVQTRKIFWTVFSIVTVTTFVTSIGAILGLLTPASWTRLRSAVPKLSGRSGNLSAEQEEPGTTQSAWRRLSSFLGRNRKGARTSGQESTLA